MPKAKAEPYHNHKALVDEWESLTQGFRENEIISCDSKGGRIAGSGAESAVIDGGGGISGERKAYVDPKMRQKALECCLEAFSDELDAIRTDASFQGTSTQVDLVVDVVKGVLFDALDDPLVVSDVAAVANETSMTVDGQVEE